jgi:hypothetical protein
MNHISALDEILIKTYIDRDSVLLDTACFNHLFNRKRWFIEYEDIDPLSIGASNGGTGAARHCPSTSATQPSQHTGPRHNNSRIASAEQKIDVHPLPPRYNRAAERFKTYDQTAVNTLRQTPATRPAPESTVAKPDAMTGATDDQGHWSIASNQWSVDEENRLVLLNQSLR